MITMVDIVDKSVFCVQKFFSNVEVGSIFLYKNGKVELLGVKMPWQSNVLWLELTRSIPGQMSNNSIVYIADRAARHLDQIID